jgi:RNA polymerase sigma-70 factor (ECF subfamily)
MNPAAQNDKQWLDALAQGDEKAFTLIYNAYWEVIFGVAYATTRSKEEAQELVQEVFVSLWANRGQATIQSSIKAYLLGAIRNKVFDHYDKQKVRDRYKNTIALQPSPEINFTEETVVFEEVNSLVNEQIGRLPETTRKVFVLSRLNGCTIPEIAKEMSVSVKTVEYHLTKALKHMRLHLAEYGASAEVVAFVAILLL